MKNLLLIGPPASNKGGVQIWIKLIVNYFQQNKKDVKITHLAIERSVSLTHLLPTYKRLYYSIKDYAKGFFKLIKVLRKEQYDKIHIVSSLGAGIVRDWLYIKVAKFFKTKAIIHYHCERIPRRLAQNNFLSKRLRSNLRNSYMSIVLDERSYKAIKLSGNDNVVKIGNSFNQEIEELAKTDIQRKENKILFVGHNVRQKGIFELVEACSTIENITLDIYGPQDDFIHNELVQWIKEYGFKGEINFKGLQPQVEVYKAMREATLFVLPTYTEGFPYVIVEAMANGCPIITTPVGAIEEMLTFNNELTGYLVKPKEVAELRKQIEYCLKNIDEARVKAEKAKQKAYSEYSTSAIMNKFITIWNE